MITNFVLCQQHLVKTGILLFLGKAFAVPVCHHVKFAANNRFGYGCRYVLAIRVLTNNLGVFPGLVYKIKYAKHITMVGNSQRGHIIFSRFFIQAFYRSSAIQQRILRMYV